jgi:hypothetical protein
MLRGVAQGRPGSVLGIVDERDQVARATRLSQTKPRIARGESNLAPDGTHDRWSPAQAESFSLKM